MIKFVIQVSDFLKQQDRSAVLPDPIASVILIQLMVQIDSEEGVFAKTSSTSNQENPSTERKENRSGKRHRPREASNKN
ncbi:hypothetical protein KIN20_004765 [Parelaphostrongylus tenuis]|uniref:Uncharacterized protein n=1 Tax=Parelaphostrongylus tenuis TaxID=148309 RepID=A0AAD5M164_PARTN|nr:hypothetical protein KIN20_004765 [Parelaphostrongylus tenuis]